MRREHPKGFTLIELLIVVAIIAILAAIAVPNFLEAQTRSRVSRVVSDMRTFATAIEAYTVDYNATPRMTHTTFHPVDRELFPASEHPGGVFGVMNPILSTPIAYITDVFRKDPFTAESGTGIRLDEQLFTYHDLATYQDRNPTSAFWAASTDFYGNWRLGSVGPDRTFAHGFSLSAQLVYDPTNGTLSLGNIWRSPKNSGIQPPVGTLLGAH